MGTKLDLPDGEWCLLRDPAKVPERLRRPVTNLTTRLQPELVGFDPETPKIDADVLEQFEGLNDLLIVALVQEWSFEAPISVETVGDLPGDAYDVLRAETAKLALALFPDFAPDPDPKVPTGP